MSKTATITVCVLLLAYFLFTSGLVFAGTQASMSGKIDMPYSIALSGEDSGVLGIFTEDDIACAHWLAGNDDMPIRADYNGVALLLGHTDEYERFGGWDSESHYLFLTSWNVEYGKMVVGASPALRTYQPLPDLNGAVEAFRRGDAAVYYMEGGHDDTAGD